MPKLKTNKSASKRFKVTKHGKILHHRAGKGHLLSSKTRNRKRKMKKAVLSHKTEVKRLKRLLGLMG